MSILARLFGWEQRQNSTVGSATSSLDVLRDQIAGQQSAAGVPVNWQNALSVSTVLSCVRVVSEGIAQVPLKVFQRTGAGRADAVDHPLYRLLSRRPNDWQTSFEFREQLGLHLTLTRNAFVFVNRGMDGRPIELLPLEPGWMTVTRPKLGDPPRYECRPAGGSRFEIPPENMWHLRGLSWNGWSGLDAIKTARESIGLGLAAERFGSSFFSNGARPSGMLVAPPGTGMEEVTQIKEAWDRVNSGSGNAGKTAVIGGGLKYEKISLTPEEGQFTETRKMQIEEICRHFRVMPIMAGFTDKTATYASAEQMFLAHVVHTLMPWYERIEQSAEVNLLTERDIEQGYYIKHLPNGLMRGAAKDRADFYAKALGAGGSPAWLTQDEVRELEEYNPMGGAAAELARPTNVAQPARQPDPANEE